MGIHRKIRTRRAKIKKVNFLASPREGVRRGNFSRVTILHIISTLRPGPPVGAGRSLCRDPSFLEAGLTLPLVNPPIERGLLSNSFLAFLRLRASRPLDTCEHTIGMNIVLLEQLRTRIRPLDTCNSTQGP